MNKHLALSFICACLCQGLRAQEIISQYEVFPTLQETDVPYRIPAISTARNGDIVAVADFRYCRTDIGLMGTGDGRIDLRARISQDKGETWGNIFTVVKAQGRSGEDAFYTGFGDPCIVADRESDRVLLMSCAGNISFWGGTREKHQLVARFYSNDNGRTWSKPEEISEQFYSLFDKAKNGPIRSMFIGSGKIHQSRYTKVGKYYRLYCSNLAKDANGEHINYILYSDDFGENWKLLGDADDVPIVKGDEPKAEELPDGRVLISSRMGGGRFFNIFTFDDVASGTGKWARQAASGKENHGTEALGNSCNGEPLIVPVQRTSDGKRMHLALQSVPFGNGRANVGIYYKELASEADYATPADFAANWQGKVQLSRLPSAYSTMTLLKDNTIGFFFEEETHCGHEGGGFTLMYQRFSIEGLTGGAYKYKK